jgi:hypothetical protein
VVLGQLDQCVQCRAGDLKIIAQTLVAGVHKLPHLRGIAPAHGFGGQQGALVLANDVACPLPDNRV